MARRVGLVDHPDTFRKMHRKPIPLAGGLVIFATCFVVLSAVFRGLRTSLLLSVQGKGIRLIQVTN